MKNRSYIWLILFLILLAAFANFRNQQIDPIKGKNYYWYVAVSATNGIGSCLLRYVEEKNGCLPSGDNWCDDIMDFSGGYMLSYLSRSFGTDCRRGESMFSLNQAAAGKKLADLPDDFVLVFEVEPFGDEGNRDFPMSQRRFYSNFEYKSESDGLVYKDRWNIICGPERLAIYPYVDFVYITTADGRTRSVNHDNLNELQWDIDGTDYSDLFRQKLEITDLYKSQISVRSKNVRIAVLLGGVLLTLLVLVNYHIRSNEIYPVILFSILSALCSTFLGQASGLLHNFNIYNTISGEIGVYVGIVAGICYSAIVLNLNLEKGIRRPSFGLLCFYGFLFGIISSSIVHMAISYVGEESMFAGIIGGCLFGSFAGGLMSMVFSIGLWIAYDLEPKYIEVVKND